MEHYFPRAKHETQHQPFENVDNYTELSGTTLLDDISDQDTGYTTPSPIGKNSTVELPRVTELQNKIHVYIDNNPFLKESDLILSIDDIPHGLTFKDENSVDEFYIGDINVPKLSKSIVDLIRFIKNSLRHSKYWILNPNQNLGKQSKKQIKIRVMMQYIGFLQSL
jgi:hypothetical protein